MPDILKVNEESQLNSQRDIEVETLEENFIPVCALDLRRMGVSKTTS